jgi:GTP-binding protein SAR1
MSAIGQWLWSALKTGIDGAKRLGSNVMGLWPWHGLKRARILLLGLDGSGKTTLLQVLKRDLVQAHEPTTHPQSEEVTLHNVCFQAFDLGGHAAARLLWRRYLTGMDGIVFLVDAADRQRFGEARGELARLLETEELATVPIVVLGNKIDAPGAVSTERLRSALDLPSEEDAPIIVPNPEAAPGAAADIGGRSIALFMCSVVHRAGYDSAFDWLAAHLPLH